MKNKLSGRLASLLLVIFALSLFSGCTADDPVKTEEDLTDWPDLTEKEDVIETIRLCYENYKTATMSDLETHYRDILYQEEGNEYVFWLHPDDVETGQEPFMSLTEDVAGSMYIWEHANALALYLSPGIWIPVEIEGCDDCFTTSRTYTITTSIDHHGEIFELTGVNMTVEFIVRPQHDDPTKWAIYIAYDRAAQ